MQKKAQQPSTRLTKVYMLDGQQYLSIKAAAQELGVSTSRVRALIRQGRLKARRYERLWLIASEDLDAVRERKTGWVKGRSRRKPSGETPSTSPL